MTQLRQKQKALDTLGLNVAVISFSAPAIVETWIRDMAIPYPILLDPEKKVYDAYGLERTTLRLIAPRTVLRYARMWRQWHTARYRGEDGSQLGGDFIVSPDGVLCFAHRSSEPADRPDVPTLLAATAKCGA